MHGLLLRLAAGLPYFWAALSMASAVADPAVWRQEWPHTDFSRHAVAFNEIVSGGSPKDGIPAIDNPSFASVSEVRGLAAHAPVISVVIGGDARAYPLRIMIWHEIVNDAVGGVPIAVTWCPLCNSSVVFDRRLGGRTLSFGTTGKLRNSDLVMYDRETESWWQQFGGECIVGTLLGAELKLMPMRVEAFDRFASRFPNGRVLLPPASSERAYGRNPYQSYDRAASPFLYRGKYAGPAAPLARIVAVGEEAWTLDLLKKRRHIEAGNLVLSWEPGQASPLDAPDIDAGQDIGNVVVQRRTAKGLEDAVYDVSFAFAFRAFHPQAPIHVE
jgi:Protein of unknown function (DUF3179)